MKSCVIYESKGLLGLNKKRGIPVHPLSVEERETLFHEACEWDSQIAWAGPKPLEGGLLHRIDNDTSGVVLFCRQRELFEDYFKQMLQHETKKEYLALVVGITPIQGKIDLPIAHDPQDERKMKVFHPQSKVRGKPRNALTLFETLETKSNTSLIKIYLNSACRHQIRVHMASLGFPLCGDKIYQSRLQHLEDDCHDSFHYLHALNISLFDSSENKQIKIEAPWECPSWFGEL